eukprot:TRINITY_DN4268_c0_g1_i3.p1 TRINITY_DN4268_c0_g1~~TRINITY_DN4268_c0_g1_i3.p1  ORF type:complete len:291 (-),score=88.48 TRINITY_DN4268_c0_g1_i3:33-872(-)
MGEQTQISYLILKFNRFLMLSTFLFLSFVALASAASAPNVRQKVACDICINRPSSCTTYNPDATMFSSARPPAYKLGALNVCEPSEREVWTTLGSFKIGDSAHPPEEDRAVCPGYPTGSDPSGRRKANFDGKLGFVRTNLCGLFNKNLPTAKDVTSCSTFVNKVAPTANGGAISCADRFAAPPAARSEMGGDAFVMPTPTCNTTTIAIASCDADAADVQAQSVIQDDQTQQSPSSSGLSSNTVVIIAVVCSVAGVALLVAGVLMWRKHRAPLSEMEMRA